MRDDFPVVNRPRGKMVAPRPVQEIACSRCPNTDAISAAPSRQPAHTVALKFGQRGWRVVGIGKHVCPACVAAEAARKKAPQSESIAMAPKVAPSPTPAPANETAGHASAAASDAIVNLSLFLSDYYDKARKAYAEGWDDDRMARETGLSPVHVAEFREKYFGPLVKDTMREDLARGLVGLSKELGGAKAAVAELSHTLGEAAERLDFLEKRLCEAQGLAVRLGVSPAVKAA